MMGTTVNIYLAVAPDQEPAAQTIAERCLEWLRAVETHLSRFHAESELCQLNRAAGRWFSASPLLFAAVATALHAAQSSDGLFDPTLLPRLEALGYDRDFAEIAHREVSLAHDALAQTAVMSGGWRAIELDPRGRRIHLPAGVRLDLGGIAKGWAADVALERFCGACPGALVNVGGDLRARGGPQPGKGWPVGILGPGELGTAGEQRQIATITLSRGGLATSGALRRWWYTGGIRCHHLLDPRSGLPVPLWIDGADETEEDEVGRPNALLATATALAPTATAAEVAAKVALLRGLPAALECVEADWRARQVPLPLARQRSRATATSLESPVALLLTLGNGELRLSANLREYLATWSTEGAPVPDVVSFGTTSERKLASKPEVNTNLQHASSPPAPSLSRSEQGVKRARR
jgi:thiamine biosynthesis lipoprotein